MKLSLRTNQNGIGHVMLVALIVLVIGVVGLVGYRVVYKHRSPPSSNYIKNMTILNIQSVPSGISMAGQPLCDAAMLHKITNYSCANGSNDLKTTIIAPTQVTLNGKTYSFTNWDGCSESNVNKNVCKTNVMANSTHTIKATYSLSPIATSPTSIAPKTPSSPSQPAKPPVSDCPNTSNSLGIVTCKTTVFQVPFGFVLTISYPQDSRGHQYYADVVRNPYIYCNPSSACDTINEPSNVLPNIVGPMNQPGTMFMNLLSQVATSDGTKLVFDHWSTVYDPNRYPNVDPNQHTVYLVTAYYVLAPN